MNDESQAGQPRKEDNCPIEGKATTNEETTSNHPVAPQPISPTATRPIESSELGPTPNDAGKTDPQEKGFFDRHKSKFEGIAISVGVCAVAISAFQSYEMVQATHASQGQLDEMRLAARLDERAWLTPYIADNNLIFITNGQVQVRIDIKNSGKTPAILTGFGIKAMEDTNDFPARDNVTKISMIASPNADNIRLFSGLPAKEIQDLISKNRFYVYGVITYQDIFKADHWTEFCWSVVGGDFNAAPFHNGWGDTETNQTK